MAESSAARWAQHWAAWRDVLMAVESAGSSVGLPAAQKVELMAEMTAGRMVCSLAAAWAASKAQRSAVYWAYETADRWAA